MEQKYHPAGVLGCSLLCIGYNNFTPLGLGISSVLENELNYYLFYLFLL